MVVSSTNSAGGPDIAFYVGATALKARITLLHSTALSATQSHGIGSILRIELSSRYQNRQLDQGLSPGSLTNPRLTGLLCM